MSQDVASLPFPHAEARDSKHVAPEEPHAAPLMLFLVALLLFIAGVWAAGHTGRGGRWVLGLSSGASAVLATTGVGFVVVRWRRAGTTPRKLALLATTLANLGMMALGALGVLLSMVTFARGRQLRRFGRVLLPPVAPGRAWSSLPATAVPIDPAVAAGMAARWRENGRTEHASVAAFARLTLDLMALGAPPALVRSAQRDALDEIRHTELCFSLARSLDGRDESPGPFPEAGRARARSSVRAVALGQLAVDSLVDGALNEGVSARVIASLARRCEVPGITTLLRELAADEGRHAANGWHVVAWCLEEGGEPVASALRGALHALPATMRPGPPGGSAAGGWERYGIPGTALEAREYARCREDVVRRVETMISVARAAA